LASCAALLLLLVMPVITLAFLAPRESSADAVLVSDVGGISERRMENINRPPVVESTMSHSIPSVPTVNSLTVSQLEAILAHELAHIRRADFVVNLLQSAIETLLFYHPAVWWISSSIRQEREHCCDDLAASISGDKAGYVAALVRMEELRSVSRAVALAARGGNLLVRVRRLLRPPAPDRLSHWWLTGMMTSLIVVSLIALPLRAKLKAESIVAEASTLKNDKKSRKSESRKNEARLAIVEGLDNITPAQIADRIEEAWKRYESIEYEATIEETRNTTAFSGDAKPTLVDGTGKTAGLHRRRRH